MRKALGLIAAAALIYQIGASLAQGSDDNPGAYPAAASPNAAGWTMGAYGIQHEASSTVCPPHLSGFDRLTFVSPPGADMLGACVYVDDTGTGDAGMRVRRYLPGVGETREIIDNDHALMEPDPVQGAPLFTVRMAPVTTRDGKMSGRLTITKVRSGYLIDCFAEGISLQIATAKIALICGN
jgi:hypothetical protein